jgi:predicted amidohydrolase
MHGARVAVVQTRPVPGAIDVNVQAHERWIDTAATHGADMVFFPELSLTGYEPKAAERLAVRADDPRLDLFDTLSRELRITIGLGQHRRGGHRRCLRRHVRWRR